MNESDIPRSEGVIKMVETLVLLFVFIVCLIALVATIFVGKNPVEKNYEATTKKRVRRLLIIYGISAIVFLALLYILRS